MKKLQQFSLLSGSPNPLSSIRIDVTIMSASSSLNKSGMSPVQDLKEQKVIRFDLQTTLNLVDNIDLMYKY